jgi:hypothetical protein
MTYGVSARTKHRGSPVPQYYKSVSSVDEQALCTHCVHVIFSVRNAMRITECGVESFGIGLEIAETETGLRY